MTSRPTTTKMVDQVYGRLDFGAKTCAVALVEAFQRDSPAEEAQGGSCRVRSLQSHLSLFRNRLLRHLERGIRIEAMRNDGWTNIAYELVEDAELNARLSKILNEVCHVFHLHAGGTWQTYDKDRYAAQLAQEIGARPGLTRKLLAIDDRVIKMVTYRAIELLKAAPSEEN